MANLTIAIDDTLLKRARIRALEEGTSVNALLRDYLTGYADSGAEEAVRKGIADLARRSVARSGDAGLTWSRDDLHARDA